MPPPMPPAAPTLGGPDTIDRLPGGRPVDRETCFCACHDLMAGGRFTSGVPRDAESEALMACPVCRWAHCVAFSTADWRNDDRYLQPRLPTANLSRR